MVGLTLVLTDKNKTIDNSGNDLLVLIYRQFIGLKLITG